MYFIHAKMLSSPSFLAVIKATGIGRTVVESPGAALAQSIFGLVNQEVPAGIFLN
jgi:hypothetical protein